MEFDATTLPTVDPMMVRQFTPAGLINAVGGCVVMDRYLVEDVGIVGDRLDYDEERVDCSHRIFEITNLMILVMKEGKTDMTVFPSRRWRNLRKGELITDMPGRSNPLLYIGNPVRLIWRRGELCVIRTTEFIIRSGVQLGY